jgi:hypothetical protein
MSKFNSILVAPSIIISHELTAFQVQGLAVDWVSRNLYWTDATYNWIGMTPLKHEDKYKFIITKNLFSPHGIGVHPKTRSAFEFEF